MKTREIKEMLETKLGRKKLGFIMIPAIRSVIEGCPGVARQALFMKRTSAEFSRSVTWKDMEKYFGLKRSSVRGIYENMGWDGWWVK
jgi:hypothetical protein